LAGVSAIAFCTVHCIVRDVQQDLRIDAVVGVEPDPDTCGGQQTMVIDVIRKPQGVQDLLGKCDGIGRDASSPIAPYAPQAQTKTCS